jgi:hypothetical protein
MQPDFDAMAHAARSLVNKAARHDLWKAALHLDEWYFVGVDHAGEAEPLVGMYEGRPYLFAFTDGERAEEFANARAARKGGDAGVLLTMPPSDAVEYLVEIREQVDGILINSGEFGFTSEPMDLKDMRDRYLKA